MKVIDIDEVRALCAEIDIEMTHDGLLHYMHSKAVSLKIKVPEAPEQIVLLAFLLLGWKEEISFHGSLFWLQLWDVGCPQVDRVGWKAIEQMRRGYGELRPIETASGHLFRFDELVDANAFAALALLFRWSYFIVPPNGEHFVYVEEGETAYFIARTEEALGTYLKFLEHCKPERESPSYFSRFDSATAGRPGSGKLN